MKSGHWRLQSCSRHLNRVKVLTMTANCKVEVENFLKKSDTFNNIVTQTTLNTLTNKMTRIRIQYTL